MSDDLVSPAGVLVESKVDVAHDEEVKQDAIDKMEYVPVSSYATMTRGQAVKLFWRVSIVPLQAVVRSRYSLWCAAFSFRSER